MPVASADHDGELVLCLSLLSDGTVATFFPQPLPIERTGLLF
jgi:hypothetical protein